MAQKTITDWEWWAKLAEWNADAAAGCYAAGDAEIGAWFEKAEESARLIANALAEKAND